MSAVDKLDVEELRAASTRLRCDHDFSFVERGCTKCGIDTRPVVDELVEPLAAWLDSEAARRHIVNASLHQPTSGGFTGFCSCGSLAHRPDRDAPTQCGRLDKALTVARVINGTAS